MCKDNPDVGEMAALERELECSKTLLAEVRERRDKLRAELQRALMQRADDSETELAKCS